MKKGNFWRKSKECKKRNREKQRDKETKRDGGQKFHSQFFCNKFKFSILNFFFAYRGYSLQRVNSKSWVESKVESIVLILCPLSFVLCLFPKSFYLPRISNVKISQFSQISIYLFMNSFLFILGSCHLVWKWAI